MKFYEYGVENIKTLLFFQATAEPWWIFEPSAKSLADDFHVFLAASDGHDPSQDNDYESVEKTRWKRPNYCGKKGSLILTRYTDRASAAPARSGFL